MKNLFEVDKEELVQRLDVAVKKKSKMVLSNSASSETTKVNTSSMKSWVESSPFFVKEGSEDKKSED